MKKQRHRKYCRGFLTCSLMMLSCMFLSHAQENSRKLLKRVEAQYPAILKSRGIGGTVRLKVVIKPDGAVKGVEIIGGSAILADSAVAAVNQWRFSQGAADTTMEVSVVFDPRK
jgi:TonB family protein